VASGKQDITVGGRHKAFHTFTLQMKTLWRTAFVRTIYMGVLLICDNFCMIYLGPPQRTTDRRIYCWQIADYNVTYSSNKNYNRYKLQIIWRRGKTNY